MAIAIIGSETLNWKNQEQVNVIVNSILRQKIKIVTGYGKGLDAMVRAALFSSKKRVYCEFYSNILDNLKDGKKEGLIAFDDKPYPDNAEIWETISYAIPLDIPVIVFSENEIPHWWRGGEWVMAGVGVWGGGLKWRKF